MSDADFKERIRDGQACAARPDKNDAPKFEAPGNIVFLAVDKQNGAVLPTETPGSINEAFISGTQPGANSFNRQP